MKQVKIILLVIIVLSFIGLKEKGRAYPIEITGSKAAYRKGTFELSNTTETAELMKYGAQENQIGLEYNITINMNTTSTSAINLTLTKDHWWRGSPHIFQMVPNETRTVTYVQHSTADSLGILNFDYHLLNTSGVARGTYKVIRVFGGYQIFVGTGGIVIDNITKWLNARSQTSDPLNLKFSFPFLVLSITLACYYRKKRDRAFG